MRELSAGFDRLAPVLPSGTGSGWEPLLGGVWVVDAFFLSDVLSDAEKAGIGGFVIGALFGVCAQASGFCLRSACLEFIGADFRHGRAGRKMAIWLAAFAAALVLMQGSLISGAIDRAGMRQLETAGTMSGAILGGVMFGIGMVMARGCASRLLVLSATGNLRAVLTGLVLTLVAQASLTGVLAPAREALSTLWIVAPTTRDVGAALPTGTGLVLGLILFAMAVALAVRQRLGWGVFALSTGVGVAVAAGWHYTAALSAVAFDPVPLTSITFTGPASDTVMALIAHSDVVPRF